MTEQQKDRNNRLNALLRHPGWQDVKQMFDSRIKKHTDKCCHCLSKDVEIRQSQGAKEALNELLNKIETLSKQV